MVIQYTHCDGCHNPSAHSMRCAVEKRRSVIAVFFILSGNTEYASYIANNHFITAQHKMIVLSLFDGISCARVALQRAGFDVELYLASEVDKYAIQVAKQNRSETQHVGNVKSIRYGNGRFECEEGEFDMSSVNLLIGGSPCQDLSIAKKNRKGLDGEKSGLFREYVRILKETKPKRFILENVASMSKDSQNVITETLGVEPIMINAALVSAQSRKRLFRTNIPGVTLPEDRGILLKDIIEDGTTTDLKAYCLTANYQKMTKKNYDKGQGQMIYGCALRTRPRNQTGGKRQKRIEVREDGKANCMTSVDTDSLIISESIRKLTPVECERLQCLPDEYTSGISNSQRYKCLGNAFNVDVVAHILSFIPKNNEKKQ